MGLQRGLENRAYDRRVQLVDVLGLGNDRPSGQVVIVGIDERSIIREKPLLFIYDDIGRFLRRMDEYGVRTVGLDVILVHKQSDKLKAAAAVFMADNGEKTKADIARTMEEVGEKLDMSVLGPIMDVSGRVNIVQVVHGDMVPFYYGVSPFIKNMTLADASLTDGEFKGNDGVIRKQAPHGGDKPAFASVLYRLSTGRRYGGGEVFLNYRLADSIPFYYLDDVVGSRVDRKVFSGKTVILGYISGYEDVHATPLMRDILPRRSEKQESPPPRSAGARMPGPVIHSIIAETMLTGTSLREAPLAVNIAILVVLAGISLAAITLMRPLPAIAAVVALAILFFIVNLLLFAAGSYVHLFPQGVAPFVVAVLIYPYRYLVEEKARRKVQKVFGYYIDRNVLDRLLEEDSGALLTGEARNVSILFLDIRNFTVLSTKKDAREVVRFLNFFFGAVTETIQKHAGFVNKFIGDGILAFFMTGENPAADAVSAAREILGETKLLNSEDRFREFIGDWQVNVGIGIHYGEVILGNIGSEKKMDFTIIGEHVNIASRIEGLTKEVGAGLLVSGAARTVAGDAFLWRDAGEFAVKGIDRPISLYTVGET
jgi:class 3 adenylate cyclase